MPTLEDLALAPDANAQFQAYKAQRMKGVWPRMILWGVLLIVFVALLPQRIEYARHSNNTTVMIAITALWLARFGYAVYRFVTAHRDVANMKRSLGV